MGASGLDEAKRRLAILDAAQACFTERGYAGTRVEDIARVVGLSRPLVYRQFKNKEAVLVGLAEHLLTVAIERATEALATDGDVWQRIGAALVAWSEDHFRLMASPRGHELVETEAADAIRPVIARGHTELARIVGQALRDAKATGAWRPPPKQSIDDVTDVLVAAHNGFKQGADAERYRARVNALIETFRQAC